MRVDIHDLNDFAGAADAKLVKEIMTVVASTPLHIKKSDQAGKQGSFIFDPVGTNNHIENELKGKGWLPKVPIPSAQQALGIDVDFGKAGHLAEVLLPRSPVAVPRPDLAQAG